MTVTIQRKYIILTVVILQMLCWCWCVNCSWVLQLGKVDSLQQNRVDLWTQTLSWNLVPVPYTSPGIGYCKRNRKKNLKRIIAQKTREFQEFLLFFCNHVRNVGQGICKIAWNPQLQVIHWVDASERDAAPVAAQFPDGASGQRGCQWGAIPEHTWQRINQPCCLTSK